ncbi:flagellar motor stator protein MotA [Limnohabitans sp. Rim8]|uniref:flagellar motor stator protein MotA n=1 Tax=Limnohabitans sp. Rim8 TaxID=1100718 RepID=UPI002612B4E0|nr:flagellar motor stator protein MotA [Limnohabitans sp. Rim8]
MVTIIGVVVLMVCVFGLAVLHGEMGPILAAAPHELFIILGSGIGGMLIGNSGDAVKGAVAGIGKIFKGPSFNKADYLATIFLVSKLMKVLKAEGAVALEAHIENPEASAIFGEFPKVLKEHALLHLITDTVRLMVVSQGNLDPMAVEDVMNLNIKTHHHGALQAADTLGTLAGALPALGIVACVLGVVKTMGAIDQPPTVLGALIGSALVGTFLGVFLAYGFFEPFSKRLAQIVNDEGEIYGVVKQIIIGTLNGHPMPLIIEAARVGISHHNQPSFAEVFDGMRG